MLPCVCVCVCVEGCAHGWKTTWSWFVPSTMWFLGMEFSLGGKCSQHLSCFTDILWRVDQILISPKMPSLLLLMFFPFIVLVFQAPSHLQYLFPSDSFSDGLLGPNS